MSDHLKHDMPLVELVARLHQGTTLRERVVRMRYRRRKATVKTSQPETVVAVTSGATSILDGGEAVDRDEKPPHHNLAGNSNSNNQQESEVRYEQKQQ